MAVKKEKLHFESVQELLGAPVDNAGTQEIRIDQIYPFENHPFKVLDDDKMTDLIESIRENGILVPVLVRPDDEGSYEMISGHRRLHAAKKAGFATIPAVIKEMTSDEATIAMVDANIQREEILPSERAYSLKMKMNAMRRQGFRSDLQEEKSSDTECRRMNTAEIVGDECGMKQVQVRKYVRLTELIRELMGLVDEKKVPIVIGVELSYLDHEIQGWVYEYIKENGFLKKEQVEALKKQENPENLTQYTVISIMNDALPGNKTSGRVNLSERKLDRYFPSQFSANEREQVILSLLQKWKEEQGAVR